MVFEFFKQVAPVLFANLMTVMFIYGVWLAQHAEYDEDRKGTFLAGIVAMIIPFLFVLYGLHAWDFF